MQSAVIIAAIALAVFLGYKTKINTGFFCIVLHILSAVSGWISSRKL